MSFGDSPSDILIVVIFCKELIRKCRSAGGAYDEISSEVRELYTVLRHLKIEVEAPESRLNRDSTIWERKLAPLIDDCDYTLRQLDGILAKYGRLPTTNGGGQVPSSSKASRDGAKLGSKEMDQLGSIRVKLISHKSSLTNFLDNIQLQQSGKTVTTLDIQGGQLDIILDKVDKIATKMMRKNGTVMASYDDDDKEAWKDFRRELIAEGFSGDVLQRHKDVLRAYIREIEQQGLLDKSPVEPAISVPPLGQHTSRWLETIPVPSSQSNSVRDSSPLDSVHEMPSIDPGKMMLHEENMKFPLSMKQQRAKPESRGEGSQTTGQLVIPGDRSVTERRVDRSSQPPSPIPRLVTTEEKEPYYLNTDGSSESDTESDSSTRRRLKSHPLGQVITTSALVAMSQALTLHPSSPSSFKSQSSYFEENVPRSLPQRPKQLEPSGSPYLGAIPIPNGNGKSGDRLGATARSEPIHLAPDSKGNIIPSDAKWTKISRRLVSPEVLDQAHKRYEARPEFVAVLGVLSRAEIEELAARSHILREARRRKHFPPEVPPPQPPRPIPVPLARNGGGRDTPSTDETDSDSDPKHRYRKPGKGILKNNYTHQQFQQGPPSPVWDPASAERQTMFVPQREREREKEPRKRHQHNSNHGHHRPKDTSHSQDKDRPEPNTKEKKKRFINGENLTFAGIGGAAVSLLHVLSEAAEGL